jgi:hypothetical protein
MFDGTDRHDRAPPWTPAAVNLNAVNLKSACGPRRAPTIAFDQTRRLRFWAFIAAALLQTACATDPQPPPKSPLALGNASEAPSSLKIVDRRDEQKRATRQTELGLFLGDALVSPSPATFVQGELQRSIESHPSAEVILRRLSHKQVQLREFEVVLGLRSPEPAAKRTASMGVYSLADELDYLMSASNARRWEVVRVRVVVDVDGLTYEGSDVHPYEPAALPSPLAVPARGAVVSIVNQLALF